MRDQQPLIPNLDPAFVGKALRDACLIELRALKPGNVHYHAPGHGMTAADFERSAEAVAAVFAQPGLMVGGRILRGVEATRAAVGCNTNLGIVLLAAPLAEAALVGQGGDLRSRLGRVLTDLEVGDAEQAFQAIRLAEPAGLGHSERHDVRQAAKVTLLEAMAEAAPRDLIARQYVTDYREVFETGIEGLRRALSRWNDEAWAAADVYLGFLSGAPDSHIARKYGSEKAEELRRRAEAPAVLLHAADDPESVKQALLDFDAALKAEGLNPGTSADLTVASLFARRLENHLRRVAR